MAPAWKDETGFTLPELLLGMVLALGVAASSILMLQTTLHAQKSTGSRLAAQDDGSFAMLRLTKDIRSATAASLRDARTLDLLVPQNNAAGGAPVIAHIRYQCAGLPATCTRYTCSAPYSSSSCGSPSRVLVIASGVVNTANFRGVSMGVDQPFPSSTPASWAGTGSPGANNIGFIAMNLQVMRTDDVGSWASARPLDFNDGADLGNFTN
jgi:Tfp pilus assembly protein PilW